MITPNNKVCYDSNLGAIFAAKCLSGNITNLYWPETFHLGQLRYTDDDQCRMPFSFTIVH